MEISLLDVHHLALSVFYLKFGVDGYQIRNGLIDLLEKGDMIIANRGFDIQESVASKGTNTVLPKGLFLQLGKITQNRLNKLDMYLKCIPSC